MTDALAINSVSRGFMVVRVFLGGAKGERGACGVVRKIKNIQNAKCPQCTLQHTHDIESIKFMFSPFDMLSIAVFFSMNTQIFVF